MDDLGSGPHILLLLKNGYSPRLFRFVIPNNHEGNVSVGNILLQPEPVATANITGTVTDANTEEPLFGVAVSVNGVTVASTDLNGVFSIEAMDVQWGANLLRVRRFGYEPMEEELWIIQPRAEFDVLVELSPLAIELPTVVVEGERTVYDYAVVPGFERRRRWGLGRYFTKQDIVDRHAMWVADILRFVRVDGPPNIFIDGMRIMGTSGIDFDGIQAGGSNPLGGAIPGFKDVAIDIDEWVNINDIVGIEVYRSRALAPLRFSMFGERGGVILIWTNRGG